MVDRKGNTPAHLAVLYAADSCLAVLVKYQRPNTAKNKPFPELDLKNYDGKDFSSGVEEVTMVIC